MQLEWRVALSCFLLLTIGVPLWWGWRAVRTTSLRHTMLWLWATWLIWLIATAAPLWTPHHLPFRYLGVCMAACVAVAVLGARQPGMAAWNFVLIALLALLLLPLLEQPWDTPRWRLDLPRAIFLGAVLLVGIVNYFQSGQLGFPVFVTALVVAIELLVLTGGWRDYLEERPHVAVAVPLLIAVNAWGSAWLVARAGLLSTFDACWLNFRNRYGLVWARRVQEQFNAAVKNGGGSERLEWRGLIAVGEITNARHEELLVLLQATLKRFGIG